MDDDRLPPQDLGAELAVLGCCLLEKSAMERVAGHVRPEDFYREAHQIIYGVIYELYEEDAPVDIVTVAYGLRRIGKLESCGGAEYLTALIGEVPTSKHVDRYVKTLKNCSALRAGIKVGSELQALCYSHPTDPAEAIGIALRRIQDLQEMCHANGMPKPMSELAGEHIERIERRRMRAYEVGTAKFGLHSLDRKTGGLEDYGYILVKAETNMGKTGFMIQCTMPTCWAIQSERSAALDLEREAMRGSDKKALKEASRIVSETQKKCVVVFAMEEGGWQWHLRMAGYAALFDTREARNIKAWDRMIRNRPSLEDEYAAGLVDVAQLPIEFSKDPQTISSIESHCRRIARDKTPVLIVVDYAQRIGLQDLEGDSDVSKLGHVANRLRRLADDLRCPIEVGSQVTVSGTGKQRTAHAQWATALEHSADTIFTLRRKVNAETGVKADEVDLICEKTKNGVPFGCAKCYLDPHTGRWTEIGDKPGDPPAPQDEKTKRPDRRNE